MRFKGCQAPSPAARYGFPERPLHEAGKVKPGIHWKPQDVGGALAMRHFSRRADTDWSVLQAAKLGGWSWLSPLPSHKELQFGVCPAGFGACFGPVFPHYSPILPCWNCSVCSVSLYVGSMQFAFGFCFCNRLQLRACLESQRRFLDVGVLHFVETVKGYRLWGLTKGILHWDMATSLWEPRSWMWWLKWECSHRLMCLNLSSPV